jgi:hypothetical protein
MIVKIQKAGSSFKSLTNYLVEQKERVAWTHSLNCANDDVLSVVNEMYSTFSQAELLKEHAGVHAGGSVVDKPVKHISLNWHPDENPTREEMIAAAESFLKHMGWEEHQALLVAHNDKAHSHVHIELNRIHPETGKALSDGFERRRASDWGLDYEREHGLVRCQQRELDHAERTPSPTRETWEQLRDAERKFDRDEKAERERAEGYLGRDDRDKVIQAHEWQLLKAHQRAEREAHFAEGKTAFKEVRDQIYRTVREEFRFEWSELYAAKRAGTISGEEFELKRSALAEWQRDKIEFWKEEAFAELKAERAEVYKELLSEQKLERHELHRAQDSGQTSYDLLDLVGDERKIASDQRQSEAANQNEDASEKAEEPVEREDATESGFDAANDNMARVKNGLDGASNIGHGVLGGIALIAERLFDGFFGGPPERSRKPPTPEPDGDARARRQALRFQRVEEAIEAAQAERDRARDEEYWRDRRRSRD